MKPNKSVQFKAPEQVREALNRIAELRGLTTSDMLLMGAMRMIESHNRTCAEGERVRVHGIKEIEEYLEAVMSRKGGA